MAMEDCIMLYVNSSKKTSGITSQFSINLPRPITHAKAYEITGVEVPYTFYDIWNGNTGIAEITPTGNAPQTFYAPTGVPIFMPSFYLDWAQQAFTFVFNNNTYNIITTQPADISLSSPLGDVVGFNFIGESIMAANIPGISSCVVSLINYKIRLYITTTITCVMLGLVLQGTDPNLALFMGLSQNTISTYSSGATAVDIYLPSTYNMYTSNVTNYYIYNSQAYFTIGSTTYRFEYINPGDGLVALADGVDFADSKLVVDPDRHYLGYILGYNGSYNNRPGALQRRSLDKFPLHYDLRLFIQALDPAASPSRSFPAGHYTGSEAANQINTILQTTTEFKTSVFSYNESTRLFTAVINTANQHNSIAIGSYKYSGQIDLFEKLGFAPGVQTITGVNITTATFHSIYPYNPGTKFLYVCSDTLSDLTDAKTFTDVDNPIFKTDNIIHKIQVNVKPTKIIRDNGKFAIRKTITKSFQPITSIDFELRDQDLQLVQLNGRSWAISIRFIL